MLALLEQTGDYDRTFWETAVAQGWTGVAIPEAFGGLGLGGRRWRFFDDDFHDGLGGRCGF